MHGLAVKHSNSDQAIGNKYIFSVCRCSLGLLCAIILPNGKCIMSFLAMWINEKNFLSLSLQTIAEGKREGI